MTKTFYVNDTDPAAAVHAASIERESTSTDPGTASAVERQVSVAGSANNQLCFAFYSPSGEPNSADWPAASVGDEYKFQIDVATAGADLTYGASNATGGHGSRVNTGLSSDLETQSGQSTIGTGIKVLLAAPNTWDPAAGAASDRFEVLIGADNTNMMAQTLGIRVNTSNTFLQGPWLTGTTFQQAIAVVSTFSVSLGDVVTFARALSVGSTFAAGMSRLMTYARSLSAISTFTPSLARTTTYFRTLAATSTFVAVLNRGLFVALAVASSFSAGISSAKLFTRAVDAVSTFAAGLTQQVTFARSLAVSSTFGASLTRVVGKMLAASSTFSVGLQKQMYVSLAVTSAFGLELRKMVSKTLAVSSAFSPVVASSFVAVRSLAATSAMVAAMATQFIAGTVLVLRRKLLSMLGVE